MVIHMKKSEIKELKKIVKKIDDNKKKICKRFDIDKKDLKAVLKEAKDVLEHGSDREIEAFAESFTRGFERKIAAMFGYDEDDLEFEREYNKVKKEVEEFDIYNIDGVDMKEEVHKMAEQCKLAFQQHDDFMKQITEQFNNPFNW